jgi:hypothetical protein
VIFNNKNTSYQELKEKHRMVILRRNVLEKELKDLREEYKDSKKVSSKF